MLCVYTLQKMKKLEQLTNKLTLIIIGLTAGSALLVPTTYASFHPVTTGEIADETIRSRDILNGQVGSVDIGTGQVATVDIRNDAIRPNIQIVSEQMSIPAMSSRGFEVDCPDGRIVTGGGYFGSTGVHVYKSSPLDANTWHFSGRNTINSDLSLTGYALCIGPMP